MLNSIFGAFRDVYHFVKENIKDWLCFFAAYMAIGCVATTIIYGFNNMEHNGNTAPYCNWKPNRIPSAIYWTIEYLPKKTSCLIWEPFDKAE